MSVKWKIPDLPGFATLIESIKNARRASVNALSGVAGLQEDIQGLANRTTLGFQQADTALQTLGSGKLDKTKAVSFSIPPASWGMDSEADEYPAFYELAVAGVTAKDRATIALAPSSVAVAVACGMCPTCETVAGKIKIRATVKPTEAIAAEYWLETGKE